MLMAATLVMASMKKCDDKNYSFSHTKPTITQLKYSWLTALRAVE
jgi:hypothetical protein